MHIMIITSPAINHQQTAHPAINGMLSVNTLVKIVIAKNVPIGCVSCRSDKSCLKC